MACEVLISIGGKIAELLVEPVGRRFGYVIYTKTYIEKLRGQVEMLEALRIGVQQSIDPVVRNRDVIRQDVKHWIEKADGFMGEANKFLEDGTNVNMKCFNGWFPDLVTRYRLGKKANEKTGEAEELRQNGDHFNIISNPAPPSGIESMPKGSLVSYETTNLAMMEVMEALSDDKINFIGIHGIGGVGKTTLVKEIGKKAKAKKLFDEVVMAVVSQNADTRKIQDQIAGMLGLKLVDQPSEFERTSKLRARLKDAKRVLVILDDVWERLDLAAVGIPLGHDHQGCKMIITARREQVCSTMGTEREKTKIVHLGVLSEQESWDLFRKNVGDTVNNHSPMLNDVAKEVSKECRGLPIALVTVGRAMRGKYDLEEWKEAAQELRKSVPTNIEGVNQRVYTSLKLSYDYLHDAESKACFLLCSLFPEDHDILIEDLVRYGMGLRVFKNVDTVQEARGRAKTVINNLKASCLLLTSDIQGCIKMHDVVRDVAISIGSTNHFVRAGCSLKNWPNVDGLDQYTAISLMKNQISTKLPDAWKSPNLEILLLQWNEIYWSCHDIFFAGMKALKVLDLSDNTPLPYTPSVPFLSSWLHYFNELTCLRTLILEGTRLGDITFVGQIKTLEILSLKESFISKATDAIEKLTNLRLLDMSRSEHDFCIPANGVSLLSHLEELYLFGTKIRKFGEIFSPEGPAVEVAALRSLPRLNVLTICIVDITQIPKHFVFPELESFVISMGSSRWFSDMIPNYLLLEHLVGPMTRWRRCLKMLLKRANHLSVRHFEDMKDIFPNLSTDADGLNVLKFLTIEECGQFEYLINTEERGTLPQPHGQQPDLQVLSNLERLRLFELDAFKGICQRAWGCFPKLRELLVGSCPQLSTVLLPFNLLRWLQHLERLLVRECNILEQVFDFGPEGEGLQQQLLSSLRMFTLYRLPRLQHIFNCSSRRVNLCNLTLIYVGSCNRLKYLFQPSIARALQQLEKLYVTDCEELEEICAKQNEGQEERVDKIVFKSLKTIKLKRLPNISGFCTGKFVFEWPSLEKLRVNGCPKMKTFSAAATSAIQSTPKLKDIKWNNMETTLQGMDLNKLVQNHFKAKEIQNTFEGDSETESEWDYEEYMS